jgi:hypothetical protein
MWLINIIIITLAHFNFLPFSTVICQMNLDGMVDLLMNHVCTYYLIGDQSRMSCFKSILDSSISDADKQVWKDMRWKTEQVCSCFVK